MKNYALYHLPSFNRVKNSENYDIIIRAINTDQAAYKSAGILECAYVNQPLKIITNGDAAVLHNDTDYFLVERI